MKRRKQWKSDARKVLKRHYWLFVVLCLFAAMLGTECTSSLTGMKMNVWTQEGTGQTSAITGFSDISQISTDIFLDSVSEAVRLQGESEENQERKQGPKTGQENAAAQKGVVLGRTRGVFAMLVNGFTSGSFLASLILGIRSITGSQQAAVAIFIMLSLVALFSFRYFVLNVFQVILRRMYLEGRCYEKVPAQRAMFLLKVCRWRKAAITLLLQSAYLFFWSLTIIGGIVKRYSYGMVPYIIAENPDMDAGTAITLSRKLMKGHKWECFVLDLSFLGWEFLGAVTMGLVNIFYTNPYRNAVKGEYYIYIRQAGKDKQIENAELLNDEYLFKKADEAVLTLVYEDVYTVKAQPVAVLQELTGIRRWMANFLGVTLWSSQEEKQYEEEAAIAIRMAYDKEAYEGRCYPTRLSQIPERAKRQWISGLHYIRQYSVWSMIMIFFVMSFLGWLFEVILHMITDGEFVNRGVLHGPWLPIYGAGSVLILMLLNKLRRKPVLEFLTTVVLCGSLEYYIAWFLEQAYGGSKWWDYEGYFLNLHGRICAEGLLTFGLGGMLIVYFLAPLLDNLFRRIPRKVLVTGCVILILTFFLDQIYSINNPNRGEGITSVTSRTEPEHQEAS